MVSLGAIILELVQNVSLIALVVGGYAAVKRSRRLPRLHPLAIGVLFGVCAGSRSIRDWMAVSRCSAINSDSGRTNGEATR